MMKTENDLITCRIHMLFLMMTFVTVLVFSKINVSADSLSGSCGKNASWKLDESSGVLDIYGSGTMSDYAYDNPPEYRDYRDEIKSLVIHDGITGIGKWCFYGIDFTSVSISSSVKYIGNNSFYGTLSLTKLVIPKGVQTIGDGAFDSSSIKDLTIPSTVTKIGKSAFEATNISSLSIPLSVKSIGDRAFCGCYYLKKLTLANGLETIGKQAFSGTAISSLLVPSSVKTIDNYAFKECYSLKTVYFKGKHTSCKKQAFVTGYSHSENANTNLMIYGYKGSTPEKYAIKNKIGFRTYGVKIPSSTKITSLSKNKSRAKTVLKFKKVHGAYKYEIQISNSSKFKYGTFQAFTTSTKISLKGISTIFVGKKVYVRVRAYKKTKGKISVSNWSKAKSTKMKK